MANDRNSRSGLYGFKSKASYREATRDELAPAVTGFKKQVLPTIREQMRRKEIGATRARKNKSD